MKKLVSITLALILCLGLFAACGKKAADPTDTPTGEPTGAPSTEPTTELEVIRVGASVAPHAEILAVANEVLEKQGYTLDIVEYNDYILPNTATESGDLDANYFQHQAYLDNFNVKNSTHLVSVAIVHYEPFGIYAGKCTDLSQVPDGATVAVPNDPTNEARALLLLEQEGLITLAEDAGVAATKLDIVANPKNLVIEEMEAAQLPRVLVDVDLAVINGNYAISGGLKVSDALAQEDATGIAAQTYPNVLVVKEGNENSEKIKALAEALQSDEVKQFIEDTYAGAVVALF